MISAVTVLGFVVSELVLPLAVDRLGGAGIQRVKGWLTGAGDQVRPAHDGLERAARRAYLNATLSLTACCLRSFGKPVSASWRSPNRGYWVTEADALYRLQRNLRDQVRALDDPGSAVPTLPGNRGDLWTARPGSDPRVGGPPELQRALQACLLEEVRPFGLPREFESALGGGWDELVPGERTVRVDWFSLVTSFFLDDVRHDPALSKALDDELALLSDLSINVGELRSHLDAFAQTAVRLLEQLGSGLEALHDGIDEISGKLDDLAPLGRDPAWVGQEVDRLVDESRAQIFVGREDELEQLHLFVAEHSSGYLVITAPAGHGKSALLARWLGELEERRCGVAYHFFSSTPAPGSSTPLTSVDEGYVNLRRQLRDHTGHRLPRSGRGRGFSELVDLVNAWTGDRPLVVVIDGLDEADSLLEVTFPMPLPPGVYVVVAGRATGHDNPEFLSAWTARAGRHRLCLGRLGRDDLAVWLRVANAGGLASLADEPEFLDHLLAKTEGDPRYLHHLLEELAHATEDAARRRVLAQVPLGFSSYVKASIKRLLPLLDPEQRDAFVLLAVAKGPIREDEMGAALGHALRAGPDRPVLVALDDNWRVRRWLTVTVGPDCAEWSFASRQEAEIFAQHLHGVARAARRNLAAWCGTWREHEPGWTYAVRHYPEHLLDQVPERAEGESGDPLPAREALYGLAGDSAFTRQQLTRLPAEPEAALRTIQAAIRAAARTDDAGAVVRFMLRHYHQLTELRQSPVQALRSGGLDRARTLANFAPPDDSVLWHLLITLSLVEADADQARATLTQLAHRDLRVLRGWREGEAVVLLAELLGFDPVAEKLARRLLSDRARFAMVLHVLARVDRQPGTAQTAALVAALAVCWSFTHAAVRRLGLIELAPALSRAGLIEEATAALEEAARTIEEADGSDVGDEVSLSEAWARVGDLGQAARWTERVRRPEHRLRALLTLARSAGETKPGARDDALRQALLLAQARGVWWVWQETTTAWTTTFDQASPSEPARETRLAEAAAQWVAALVDRQGASAMTRVLDELWMADPLARTYYLAAIVEAARGLGEDTTAARAAVAAECSAESVPDPGVRIPALCKIATARVAAQLTDPQEAFGPARSALDQITAADERCRALFWLEAALRSLGEVSAADQCVEDAVRWSAELEDAQAQVGVLLRAARQVSPERQSQLIDEALRVAGTIASAEDRFAWLLSVATAAPRDDDEGDLEPSLQTAEAIADPGVRGPYLAAAAQREAQAGAHRRARRLAEEALAVTAQLTPLEAVPTVARIAVSQHLVDAPSAATTLGEASTLVKGIDDEVLRGQLQALLVRSWLDMGEPEAALGLARAIEHPELRAFGLWMVAGALVAAGRVEQPAEVLDEALTACFAIEEPGDRAGALLVVADAYSAGAGYGAEAALTDLSRVARQLERGPETWRAAYVADDIWGQLTYGATLGFQAYDNGDLASAAARFVDASALASTMSDQTQGLAIMGGLGYLAHLRGLAEAAGLIFDLARRTAGDATPSVDDLLAGLRLERTIRLAGIPDPGQSTGSGRLIDQVELVTDARARARLLPIAIHLAPVDRDRLAMVDLLTTDQGERSRDRVLTLLIVARSQLRAGLTDLAAASFAVAKEVAASLPDGDDRAALVAAVNEAPHLALDDTDAAAGQQAVEQRLVLLAHVAGALAEAGDHQQAAKVLLDARNNVASCAPDRVADLIEMLDQLAAEHGLTADPEGEQPAAARDRNTTRVAEPAPAGDDPERLDRGQLIARTLAAGAQQVVDVRWTLAQIELQSSPTSKKPTTPATGLSPEPVWSGAAELVSAGQAAPTLQMGMDGVRRVMAAMQLSQNSLVRTDEAQQAVLSLGGRQLLAAARQAVEATDRDGFEAYLIPSSYHPEIGAEMLALVARVYPKQLQSVIAELQHQQKIG